MRVIYGPFRCMHAAVAILSISMAAGCCMPYAVGSTARPQRNGESITTGSIYSAPDGASIRKDPWLNYKRSVDAEARIGVSDRADVGVRLTALSGIIVNYKYRLDGPTDNAGAATAIMVGGGMVNAFDHVEFEATLLHSYNDYGRFTPYGGIRAIQIVPIGRLAEHRPLAAGAFLGTRIGSKTFAVSPEVGAFYDVDNQEPRARKLMVIPSLSLHGDLLALALRILQVVGPISRHTSAPPLTNTARDTGPP